MSCAPSTHDTTQPRRRWTVCLNHLVFGSGLQKSSDDGAEPPDVRLATAILVVATSLHSQDRGNRKVSVCPTAGVRPHPFLQLEILECAQARAARQQLTDESPQVWLASFDRHLCEPEPFHRSEFSFIESDALTTRCANNIP